MTMSISVLLIAVITVLLLLCQQQCVESTQPTLLQQSFPCPPWYVYDHGDSDQEDCKVRQCHEADQLPKELKCI